MFEIPFEKGAGGIQLVGEHSYYLESHKQESKGKNCKAVRSLFGVLLKIQVWSLNTIGDDDDDNNDRTITCFQGHASTGSTAGKVRVLSVPGT